LEIIWFNENSLIFVLSNFNGYYHLSSSKILLTEAGWDKLYAIYVYSTAVVN
jgi:hypothetical protein